MRARFFIGALAASGMCLFSDECGVPNLSARTMGECASFDLFADLLVWCAKESGTDHWAQVIETDGTSTVCDIRNIEFGWNAGVRVGAGYGMEHDQWDAQGYFTWFKTEGHDQASGGPGSVFSSFLGNFYVNNSSGAGLSGVAYQRASIDWTIDFNMFDAELGRKYWVSQALSVRPFVGLKGGWIHQSIDTKWVTPEVPAPVIFGVGKEDLKNDYWGIGPSGGMSLGWNLAERSYGSFDLFGDFSGAVMWGRWSFGDEYENDRGSRVAIDFSPIESASAMLRSLMGLSWDAYFNGGRSHFTAKLGYEMQFWLNQLQFYSFETGRLSNPLTLQGGTLEFRFDF